MLRKLTAGSLSLMAFGALTESLAGGCKTSTALEQTACGAAEIGGTQGVLLDHLFQGYHGVGTDGTYAYYPAAADGKLYRIALSGGRPMTVRNEPYLRNIKSRGDRVCWLSAFVIACSVAGGEPVILHRTRAPVPRDDWDYNRDFDFDDHDIYWIDSDSVWRTSLDGSGPETRIRGGEESTKSIAVAGDRVVWTTDDFSVVRSCDKKNCSAPDDLTSWGRPPFAITGRIAADATYVYVPVHLTDKSNRRGGKLVRIPAAGGPVEPLVDCLDESPVTVGVDGTTAYLLAHAGYTILTPPDTEAGGSVYAVPLAGGNLRRLATNQPFPAHLALTPGRLLWINENGRRGELLMLPR